jgi:carbonic anhydrase
MSVSRRLVRIFATLLAAQLAGCAIAPVTPQEPDARAMTRETQSAMTPALALQRLKDGNRRFTGGRMLARDLPMQVKVSGGGQYPLASVVSCIDSRAAPELVFDQGIGDVFSVRVAGNIVNEDMLGSLEFASRVAGSRLIVVLGHTSCGAIKGACDEVVMGNLTGLLEKIRPAVRSVSYTGDRSGKNAGFVERVAEANVHRTVQDILQRSPVLKAMVDQGTLQVVGAMLDVATGEVRFY